MNNQNEKLNICFFINGFGGGGAERQCAYLINELKKDKNISVSLMYFFEGENFELVDKTDLKVFKIPSDSQYSFKNIPIINNIIAQISPHIVFSWMRGPDVLAFFLKLKNPRIKWVLSERNTKYIPHWNYRYVMRAALGRFADAIIANSEGGKLYWKRRLVPERKIKVIPNILYQNKFELQSGKKIISGSPVVLYAGRLKDQKNVLVLTEAFCKLAGKLKAGKFYIIGEGDQKEKVEDIITKHNKQNQVILLSFQNNIHEFFAAADVFVNISLYEGLPNTIIENIIFDNKMVVSEIPEHKHILGNSFPYYVKDTGNVDLVCETIEAVFADNKFSCHLKQAKKFISGLKPDVITNTYKELFYYLKNSTRIDFSEKNNL